MRKCGDKDIFIRELMAAGFSLHEAEIAWDEPEDRPDPAIMAGHYCDSDQCLDHRLSCQYPNVFDDDDH